jgi:hypothetical protein
MSIDRIARRCTGRLVLLGESSDMRDPQAPVHDGDARRAPGIAHGIDGSGGRVTRVFDVAAEARADPRVDHCLWAEFHAPHSRGTP